MFIEIKYSKVLDPAFCVWSKEKFPEWERPSLAEVEEKVLLFRDIWERKGKDILEKILKTSGLKPVREGFDVYIVSGTPRDLSDPIVIKSRYDEQEFLEVLIHEIFHRLLVLNKVSLSKEFKKESQSTINHIYVHALLKYMYLDVLKDKDRLDYNLKKSEKHKDYQRAWEIVDEVGYLNLIGKLKDSLS